MHNIFVLTYITVILIGLIGCSKGELSGSDKARENGRTDDAAIEQAQSTDSSELDIEPGQGDSGSGLEDGAGGDGGAFGENEASRNGGARVGAGFCPSTAQKILIIDLKSGWWSGNGGRFYADVLADVQRECGATLHIEYHHWNAVLNLREIYPASDVPGESHIERAQFIPFRLGLDQYTQIWYLSGSNADKGDYKTNSPQFVEAVKGTLASKARIFIGSGNAMLDHANVLADAMGWGFMFSGLGSGKRIILPNDNNVKKISSLVMGTDLEKHSVFGTKVKSIVDSVSVAGGPVASNWISKVPAKDYKTIGYTTSGGQRQPSIAVALYNSRRVFIDSGIQRFYILWGSNAAQAEDTKEYLRGIVKFLSK